MNSAIDRLIQQIYDNVYKQVFTKSRVNSLLHNNTIPIRNAVDLLTASKKYDKFAKTFANELAKKGIYGQKGLWRKYYNAAKKQHYVGLQPTFEAYEYETFSQAVQNNFTMIKSIPQRMLEILGHKYTSTLIEEVAKGALPRGSFERQLASHGHKQAKLIARTETAKLQTVITQTRAVNIGSVVYRWRASHDKRTRPSHREMDDVIVFWEQEKPLLDGMYGHAGEFPNCRCTPLPILDEDDLTESWYKVYDYRTHKIIRLSRNQLLEAIQNKQLA